MSILDYRIGPANKTLQAMQASDPEVAVKAEEVLQTQEPANQDQNFFQRLLNFVNPFSPAGAAEPNSMTMSNVGTGFNTVLDSSGNIRIVPVETNNNFPFISMADFAKNNNMISPASVVPNTQSGFATNFPTQPVKSGITQSTVGQTFEAPFVMSGGQKFAIDDPRIAERSNFVQRPTGIMTQAKDFLTKTVPNVVSSAVDFIPGMRFLKSIDRFNTLPYQDRKFIESAMQKDAKGNLTPGIYVDPSTGLLKDIRGKNVRSLMGNYAESIEQGYIDKEKSIEKSKENWNIKYGSLGNTNEYGKTWNEMNKRNVAEFNFLTKMKNKFDKQKADLKEKIKKTKSVNIHSDKPTKSGDGGSRPQFTGAPGGAFAGFDTSGKDYGPFSR
tara:strand:- start:583 stop:1737 length:1155 start_codon:yes stop_codon:yes gene_type:complete